MNRTLEAEIMGNLEQTVRDTGNTVKFIAFVNEV